MEKSGDISQEHDKTNASQSINSRSTQELLETNKFLYIASIGCVILDALFIILGIIVDEIFGLPAGIFLVLGIIFVADTQKHKMRRTTFYTIMSFLFFCFGALFVTLDHFLLAFDFGVIFLYAAGVWACIMTFRMILADGEIVKISGIVKLVCLILVIFLTMKYTVWRLNKVRHENYMKKHTPHLHQPSRIQTRLLVGKHSLGKVPIHNTLYAQRNTKLTNPQLSYRV